MPRRLALLALAAGVLVSFGDGIAADAAKLRWVAAIYLDDKGTGMRQPEGVACDDKGTLIVSDTGRGRLIRYTIDDRAATPTAELRSPQLAAPTRVQMNSRGEVFVLDGKQRRIVRFAATGESKGFLALEGVPGPQSIVPRSFAIDRSDRLHVLDVFSGRVLVLDAGGKYQRHLDVPKAHGFFSDVAVDSRGATYLLDSVKAALYAARPSAKEFTPLARDLRTHASFPTALAVDSRGVLYLSDENAGSIVLVAQDGAVLGRQLAMGWNDGLLRAPAHLCVTDKGQLFVADRGNSRVQMFAIVR